VKRLLRKLFGPRRIEKVEIVVDLEKAKRQEYPRAPYVLYHEKVNSGRGSWDIFNCEVRRVAGDGAEVRVGTFQYSYSSGIDKIFCPFQASDDRWYCLYATSYTTLSLACLEGDKIDRLDSLNDGFCPVECAIPFELKYENQYIDDPKHRTSYDHSFDPVELMKEYEDGTEESGHLRHTNFGFYAGCVWGDDSSWKMRFLDLREVPQGKLIHDEAALGYHPLPKNLDIKQAVTGFWVNPNTEMVQFEAAKSMTYRRVSVATGGHQWKKYDE
jgi:hypothetical protein